MSTTANSFLQKLIEKNWTEIVFDSEYKKGNWFIIRDTSSWWMVGSNNNPRIFDVAEPNDYTAPWTVNLIEHLCKTDDQLNSISPLHSSKI